MANCEACDNLRDYAPNFLLNGVTDTECGSLQANTGLNPDLSVLHKNCEDLHDIIDCLIGAYGDELPAYDICGRDGYSLKDYIAGLMKNLYNAYEALVCSDCGQWAEIEKIWVEIGNIYDWLNALNGVGYTRLTKGTDYTITFHNGWYTDSGDVYVGAIDSNTRTLFKIMAYRESDGTGSIPANDNLTSNVVMSHGADVATVPKSRLFTVNFIGNYAWANTGGTATDTSGSATGIWNVGGVTRASWQAGMFAHRNTSGLVVGISSYADGYNDQFTVYDGTAYTPHANMNLSFIIVK